MYAKHVNIFSFAYVFQIIEIIYNKCHHSYAAMFVCGAIYQISTNYNDNILH